MGMNREPAKAVRLLVPEDWSNDQKGEFFEKIASKLLKRLRFNIIERVRFTGMEIDLIADNLDTDERIFVECKFTRDPISANIIDLLIGKAYRKKIKVAYLFSTAPLGKEAKGVIDELEQDSSQDLIKIAFINPDKIADMFIDIYNAKPQIPSESGSIASVMLIITPQVDPFWVLEEHQNGIPQRALLQSIPGMKELSFKEMSDVLKTYSIHQGLELVYEGSSKNGTYSEKAEFEEVVTLVPVADSLDDYRPSRPKDFVGRSDVQKKIWGFLQLVREDSTNTRIMALSGPSGFGKSSVILKLADRFRNKKWINKFYLYPIDVRSARGPLFIAKALKTAIEAAINDGFISTGPREVTIESTESFLQSASIQSVLESLKTDKRVLIVFFDQFEELFTKEGLLPTFEAFKRLAFEANSARSNIVVGFSWRTGITFSEENPAYYMWHDLKDQRREILIGEFISNESSQLIGQFERELKQKLLPPLRRRLLEQGQGMPWLLKKLCIHIYREINKGTKQEDLLSKRLNIKSLFDEDLDLPFPNQVQCLRFIAERSPVDMQEVFENFDQEMVNQLYNRRLIIRTGQKYAVYWDIFREYLVEGTVPTIPWTYIPQAQFSAIIRAIEILKERESLDLEDFENNLEYSEGTMVNIITDIQNFLISNRDSIGLYHIRPELHGADSGKIAEFLLTQMKDHIVIQTLQKEVNPGQAITIDEFKQIISKSYATANIDQDTVKIYLIRLLPWFRFVGLVDYSKTKDCITRPLTSGQEFGKLEVKRRRGRHQVFAWTFLGSASPRRVVELARELIKKRKIDRKVIGRYNNRNAASDLVCLDLAEWQSENLIPANALLEISNDQDSDIKKVIRDHALETDFIKELMAIMRENPYDNPLELGQMLSKRLNRKWSEGSAKRYAGAGRSWLKFINIP